MKSRFAVFLSVALLSTLLLSGAISHAQAQGVAIPPPPAYAVAERLAGQARAAQQAADALVKANNASAAAFQREIAHRRALQAVRKYGEVVSSRTYGHTPFAAEALYRQAQLEERFTDRNSALQSLKTLTNNYANVSYPDKAAAHADFERLGKEVDNYNRTHFPQSILYKSMDFLVRICGGPRFAYSYFLAIFLISVLIKLALTPLSNKQYASMKEMQKLQPAMKEVQAKYKNDKEAQGRKMMELYREHGINPAAGCLAMLPTIPIMYLLWYMISLYQYQFANGKFLWIGSSLAHHYPRYLGVDLGQQDIPLLLLYAFSMYVTQRMTITPSLDEKQAEQQRMMALLTPFMMTYFFLQYHLPSAFILYYLIFNVLSTVQQQYYMRKRAADALPGDGGGGGGKEPLPVAPASSGGGAAKARPANARANGNSGGGRRALPGRDVPLAEAKDESARPEGQSDKVSRPGGSNGATPAARGVIAPKVHPKKKRR